MPASTRLSAREVFDRATTAVNKLEITRGQRLSERINKHKEFREHLRNLPIIRWFKRWLPPLDDKGAEACFTWHDSWYVEQYSVQLDEWRKIRSLAKLAMQHGESAEVLLDTNALEELGLKAYA